VLLFPIRPITKPFPPPFMACRFLPIVPLSLDQTTAELPHNGMMCRFLTARGLFVNPNCCLSSDPDRPPNCLSFFFFANSCTSVLYAFFSLITNRDCFLHFFQNLRNSCFVLSPPPPLLLLSFQHALSLSFLIASNPAPFSQQIVAAKLSDAVPPPLPVDSSLYSPSGSPSFWTTYCLGYLHSTEFSLYQCLFRRPNTLICSLFELHLCISLPQIWDPRRVLFPR